MIEPERPLTERAVEYKGAPLDSAKGPGFGCFWAQVVVLAVLVVLTPLSVAWGWPFPVSATLLIAVLVLLLIAGQTVIFLLRLVAADRRAAGRRRPLASSSPTVGELQDRAAPPAGDAPARPAAPPPHDEHRDDEIGTPDGGVRE